MPGKAKKAATAAMPRNYQVAPGLMRFSKARLYQKHALYKKLKNPTAAKPKPQEQKSAYVTKPIGGDKNGKQRTVLAKKEPKLTPEILNLAKRVHRNSKSAQLRKSITPGTVLIVLAGRHRGKRVVFLKQLEKSGLLLVTGPMKLNAVPLRRIAQAFVIATKTKVDVSKVQLPESLNDEYFKKKTEKKAEGKDASIFATGKSEYTVSEQRKTDQKSVDAALLAAIRAHPERKFLFGYLGSRFALAKGQYPHKMIF